MLTERLFTVNEAGEELRLSHWTIWDLLKQGKLMRTKVAGKTFIRESELQKLIHDRVNLTPKEDVMSTEPKKNGYLLLLAERRKKDLRIAMRVIVEFMPKLDKMQMAGLLDEHATRSIKAMLQPVMDAFYADQKQGE